ncbi:MAG TPA: M23 family metallopeptidase [Candidatus Angelobacter sp.]|nr:M23 family metallopeptidase [Candidatus Angelobacter sp.]
MRIASFSAPSALVIFLLAALSSSASGARAQAESAHTPKPLSPPLDVTVPIDPAAFKADGKWHLAYELHVANLGKWDCQLMRVEVLTNDPASKSIASFADAALDSMMFHPGVETAWKTLEASRRTIVDPGTLAVVYLWVTLDKLEDVPEKIRHRIIMKLGDYPEAITLEGAPITVNRNPVAVISPPLRGENWLAGNGPSNTSVHRRALVPINGRAYISQRFAIYWVQLYSDGKAFRGDPKDNRSYRAYGAEIRAVADGTVTETKDDIQQNVPNEKPVVPITPETIGGNHVIMDIGDGHFAYYAHMQPASLRVKVGDKVRRGDVLGFLGNSGNSTEPHLHFHICNASSILACEGLPYALTSYQLLGNGWTWKSPASHEPLSKRELEIPLENDVVRFQP